MPPIQEYVEGLDEQAQEVVNVWGMHMGAGNGPFLTDDFKALFDRACCYRSAKRSADNHRKFNLLSEEDAAEENATRHAFAGAHKTFYEKRKATLA